ncbi:MAG TPA: ATP-binding protein [Verrucomicrobiae bacterium]|nr:ATP-binding protein [Verrucomicrobiae bacterium]
MRTFHRFSLIAGILSVVVGYHVVLGSAFDIEILKRPSTAFSAMGLDAGVCSVLAGAGLLLLQRKHRSTRKNRAIVQVLASLIIVSAMLGMAAAVFDFDLKLPGWQTEEANFDTNGEGMALMTGLAFIFIAIGFWLLDGLRSYRSAELLAAIAGSMALYAIAGYAYQADSFQRQMSLYASVVILLLSFGLLCARADRGMMARVTSNSFGGLMARRLLPATLLLPLVLGCLQHLGYRAGLYSAEPGLALLTITNVAVFIFLTWWGVNSLHRMDSKRRQAERELQDTAAKLSRSNADLEQFAYVASHDLKEPLRAIGGSVQILQERYQNTLAPEAAQVIRHTVEGTQRMQTLIDDLLAYSRLTTREAPLEPTDCSAVVDEVLSNLSQAIAESKAIVTRDPLPTVKADQIQLLQVFQNLISNGIKYRSQRTPKIHVGVEDRGNDWLFVVRDNGIGIAPQYAERIFRIFQRLHTRKEYSGTGIGLAICKKIIERHGGKIWVESELEEGSTFNFTLPKG